MCDRCASLQMLGLASHASTEDIENAYLTLVKVWHPDRFAHDPALRREAEEKLKEINAAHDFLSADHSGPGPSVTDPGPESDPIPKRSQIPRPFQPDLEVEQSDEVERILKRQKRSIVPGILLRVGFAIGAVALLALVWFTADSILSSNDTTARWWDQAKSDLGRELHATSERIAPGSDKPRQSPAESEPSPVVPPPSPAAAPDPPQPRTQSSRVSAPNHIKGAQPYMTAGLTPMEVLSALGNPTSSTGEKMLYGTSEIDFKNGRVAGWKIDPSSPIRIKLWPDSAPAPGLTTFGVGSTKSDVIAVQGTPTLFSDNEFGYGTSLVFFQNGRVTSWKEDPASVRLRVPH